MSQYRVELRVDFGQSKFIDVMANNHLDSRYRAERQHRLLVLSTQLID